MSVSLKQAQQQALAQGVDRIDADALLQALIKKDRGYLFAFSEHQLTDDQIQQWQSWIARRAAGEPVAYITGQREFWSLALQTSPSTLIPRPDTEVLVEKVLSDWSQPEVRCLDLGTGTGAIALALKHERRAWSVFAVDLQTEAVALARSNAERLRLACEVYQGSWFEALPTSTHQFDVIVSNPPYIDAEDHHLDEGDVRFEPHSALIAADKGLADIHHIAEQALNWLTPGGALYLEHGWEQGVEVRNLLAGLGYESVSTVKDYGANERVTLGWMPW